MVKILNIVFFQAMSSFVRSQKRNFEHARAAENKDKNRYRNVITCK